jgi:hypothetical protein
MERYLAEVDINPLIVPPSRQGVMAVDGPRRVSRHKAWFGTAIWPSIGAELWPQLRANFLNDLNWM